MSPRMKVDPTSKEEDDAMEMDSQSKLSPDVTGDDADAAATVNASLKRMKPHCLSRLVSQEQLACRDCKKRKSSHAEQDCQVDESGTTSTSNHVADTTSTPPLPNPLDDPGLRQIHIKALRLEADLHPLRLVLSRLMAHSPHNRKGIFNHPVDPIALGLLDYHRIITRPMDLGSVKKKLHAVAYQSRQEAMDDIRLVFTNAMRYNPPLHPVHIGAKELLRTFERYCEAFGSCVSQEKPNTTVPASTCDASSTMSRSCAKNNKEASGEQDLAIAQIKDSSIFQDLPAITPESKRLKVLTRTSSSSVAAPETFAASTTTAITGQHALHTPTVPVSRQGMRLPKRRSSFTQQGSSHSCHQCRGRNCSICKQGCLQHEPALLVCSGTNCSGARIRKGAVYYITKDGSHQFCDRCYVGLPSSLVQTIQNEAYRYKQELLKRKNEEEIAEEWLTCRECKVGVHVVCAMHNDFVHDASIYLCPGCIPEMDSASVSDKRT